MMLSFGVVILCGAFISFCNKCLYDACGNAAFGLCGALTHVYYQGTQTDWKKITIAENNSAVTSATVYYFSETEPNAGENGGYDGEYWRWVDGKPTVWKKETEQTP